MGIREKLRRRPKPERPHIPQSAAELTPEWFSGILDIDGQVVDVRIEDIGSDIGFMGEVHRCHLTWNEGDAAEQPASVIVKVPTQNDENFAVGDAMKAYEREIVVYEQLRPTLGLPMPSYYYAAMDPDPAPWLDRPLLFLFERLPIGGVNWVIARLISVASKSKRRYILVLEDIADARPPTQLVGGSPEDAHHALELLARFHAHNWMSVDTRDTYKRIWPLDRANRVFQASYVRNRDGFLERYGDAVDTDTLARLDEIQERVPAIGEALAAEPWTMLHGDYRLDNILFRPGDDIVVLDLQGLSVGRPAVDVAYFITTALTAEHRAEEESLLRTYHRALEAAGVTTYSWDQLVHDCQLTKEMLAHRLVGSADALDTSIGTGEDVFLDVLQLRVLDWLK